MHKLEYELRALAPKVRYLNKNLGDELLSLAESSHNYVKSLGVVDASVEPSEGAIEIDGEEEIEYIVNICSDKRCTEENIRKILDLYYANVSEDSNPEVHFNYIVEKTGLPYEFVELVFDCQTEFHKEKGIVG